MADNYLRLGMLAGIGHAGLNGDYNPRVALDEFRPGQIVFATDRFGEKIFKYIRNLSGSAFAQGDLVRRVAVSSITDITSGTTTSATKVAAFTLGSVYVEQGKHRQGKHAGMMMYVLDNNDSAGAAPENEISIIEQNTADVANVDPDYPFSAALAANDDIEVLSPGWHAEDSVAADLAQDTIGVIVPPGGISDGNYGWAQQYGLCLITNGLAGIATTAGGPVIAAAKTIDVIGAAGIEMVVGFTPFVMKTDSGRDKVICFLKLYSPFLNTTSP